MVTARTRSRANASKTSTKPNTDAKTASDSTEKDTNMAEKTDAKKTATKAKAPRKYRTREERNAENLKKAVERYNRDFKKLEKKKAELGPIETSLEEARREVEAFSILCNVDPEEALGEVAAYDDPADESVLEDLVATEEEAAEAGLV